MLTQTEIRKSKLRKNILDYYQQYPYKKKCRYTKKADETNRKESLTYNEWKAIVTTYYQYLMVYLAQGYNYRFTSRLGYITVEKYKSKTKPPNFPKIAKKIQEREKCGYREAMRMITKEDVDKNKHHNLDIDGFRWILVWHKDSEVKFQRLWNIRLSSQAWDKMNTIVRKNIHNIKLVELNGNYKAIK